MVRAGKDMFFYYCIGWHSTTNRKKLYMSGRFYTVQKKSHLSFFVWVGKEHQKIGELKKRLIWI